MFTGIIEEVGTLIQIKRGSKSAILTIKGDIVTKDSRVGDSIAVNGVCFTVTTLSGNVFTADVMGETMRRTSLGNLKAGSRVNLERAMAAGGRFGGHIVSGHVDGTGTIADITKEDNAMWVTINANEKILRYVIEKGSVAIDGISLTVAYVDSECFKVSLIPHTGANTTLLDKKPGDLVNLENDIIGKYVEKLLGQGGDRHNIYSEKKKEADGISPDFLMKNGFM